MLKLFDFGLAQNTQPTEETATIVTGPGAIIGTLHYCAPEVLAGRTATMRSDIYSLGVVMYEMACGRVPFAGLDAPSLISAALRGGEPTAATRSYSKINDRTLTFMEKSDGNVTLTGRIVISADGKSRTGTTTATDARGMRVTSTAVYDKQ